MIEIKDIKSDSGNIKRFILKSEELTVRIINYGATVTDVIFDGRDDRSRMQQNRQRAFRS